MGDALLIEGNCIVVKSYIISSPKKSSRRAVRFSAGDSSRRMAIPGDRTQSLANLRYKNACATNCASTPLVVTEGDAVLIDKDIVEGALLRHVRSSAFFSRASLCELGLTTYCVSPLYLYDLSIGGYDYLVNHHIIPCRSLFWLTGMYRSLAVATVRRYAARPGDS